MVEIPLFGPDGPSQTILETHWLFATKLFDKALSQLKSNGVFWGYIDERSFFASWNMWTWYALKQAWPFFPYLPPMHSLNTCFKSEFFSVVPTSTASASALGTCQKSNMLVPVQTASTRHCRDGGRGLVYLGRWGPWHGSRFKTTAYALASQ